MAYVDGFVIPVPKKKVEAYRRKVASKSDRERTELSKVKTGVFTGAIHLVVGTLGELHERQQLLGAHPRLGVAEVEVAAVDQQVVAGLPRNGR